MRGSNTSAVEITGIGKAGFSLAVAGEQLFVSFSDFPFFAKVPAAQLSRVECPHPGHLYWPELDVDVAVASIREPGKFPLVSKGG